MNIQPLIRVAVAKLRDNIPVILTGTAVVGVVATAVLTAKAAVKADHAQREVEVEDPTGMKITPVEYVKATWKIWLLPVGAGVATIASVIMIHRVHQVRYASLMGLYVVGNKAYEEYMAATEEAVDEKTLGKIKESSTQKGMERNSAGLDALMDQHSGHIMNPVLCYDSYSGRYFRSDMQSLRKAENDFNESLIHGSYGSLNDYYALIGLDQTDIGEDLGWNSDNILSMEYNSQIAPDGQPAIALGFGTVRPGFDYLKAIR